MLSQLVASYHLLLSSHFVKLLQLLISLFAKMLLCVASPSQLLFACPSTQILTLISLSTPVLLSFLSSRLPQLIPFSTAYREAPYALVPVAQNPHDVSVAHPYVSVAQFPLYATQPQKLP